MADQYTLPIRHLRAAAIACIDDSPWLEKVSNLECWIQGAGISDGINHAWAVDLDDGFGCTARCHSTDAPADNDGCAIFIDAELATAGVFPFTYGPVLDEGADFALQCSHERDPRHMR